MLGCEAAAPAAVGLKNTLGEVAAVGRLFAGDAGQGLHDAVEQGPGRLQGDGPGNIELEPLQPVPRGSRVAECRRQVVLRSQAI